MICCDSFVTTTSSFWIKLAICDTTFFVYVFIHTIEVMSLFYLVSGEELKVMTVSWPTFRCEVRLPQSSVLNVDHISWPVVYVSERKSAAGWEQYQGPCPTTVLLTSVLAQRNWESLVGGSWHSTWHLNFWCNNVSSKHTATFLLYISLHCMFSLRCASSRASAHVSEWVSEWVRAWVSEWVSEWVRVRERESLYIRPIPEGLHKRFIWLLVSWQ
jgi:hypothetical protein